MSRKIHVSVDGANTGDGSIEQPYWTINHAAQLAEPGDVVEVRAGVYREWVDPAVGGISNSRRITYQAAPGEHVEIKGSERIQEWEQTGKAVWKVTLPNELFGDFNPYARELDGDWVVHEPHDAPRKHLGDVYLNGRSFYEAASVEEVENPCVKTTDSDRWTGLEVEVTDPQVLERVWFAQVDDSVTTIWANFGDSDPNQEIVEINVRRSVFCPSRNQRDYITVRGFELAHAATPWAPPTGDQPGLIGPNWAKGWVIEDNIIHDAKCSAVSLGKEASTGDNYSTRRGDKPGYNYQIEAVFAALDRGWNKERVGSHVVRRNRIFNCGQNGIVGHLGCVFSVIEDNEISNIGTKREFYGYEIGGIKLHAPIDVQIVHNRIWNCTLGTWLDWQTQGTRIARNVYYDNNRDLFIEVSHGPYVVDHNVFASPSSLEIFSQGGAFVNNLILGTVAVEQVLDRSTPYHLPHSTQIAGFSTIPAGDDRWIGNIFFDSGSPAYGTSSPLRASSPGTIGYRGFPANMEEFLGGVEAGVGDHERFHGRPMPAYMRDNIYLAGAQAYEKDQRTLEDASPLQSRVVDSDSSVDLVIQLPSTFDDFTREVVDGADLPPARFPDAEYEDPLGRPIVFTVDLLGQEKELGHRYTVGPISALVAGNNQVRLW